MTLSVNGEQVTCNEGESLLGLIQLLQLENKVMAAAVNMNIVKQDRWHEHQLKSDDKIELLDFVGGG